MSRTLIVIPKMFSEKELEDMGFEVPSDFNDKSREFWEYVEERLKVLSARVARVYVESACRGGVDDLDEIRAGNDELHRIVSSLVDHGAEMMMTEDRLLVLETESWLELVRRGMTGAESEMLMNSLRDRESFLSERIGETLGDGETGVLFISALQTPDFPSDIRIIKMMPFDPKNYLQTWLVAKRLQEKQKTDPSS